LNRRAAILVSTFAAAALTCGTLVAAKEPPKPQKLAHPPKWSPDVLDAFFPDARTKLVGERPNYDQATVVATTVAPKTAESPTAGDASASNAGWSKVIDAETVETEIKRQSQELAKDVTAPAQFKGGGYKDCRRDFSVLAVMFGVAGEYDGEVRWKDSAPLLRDVFSRTGHNCKVGTDQSFQEAKQRKQDLTDLISGTRPKASEAEPKANWSQVADRPPLMQRLNMAELDRLQKWLANKQEFTARSDEINHESQIIAAIADIISREGFEFADDDTYVGYARDLKQAATEMSAAADKGDYDAAHQAFGKASKACANCHEGYRQ
jgi:hypothetical protein